MLSHATVPRLAASAAVTLLALLGAKVQAARPFVTDDAGVLERASFEVEAVALRSRDAAGVEEQGEHLQTSVGIGFASQLGVSWDRLRSEGASARSLSLLGKTTLLAEAAAPLQLSLSYGIGRIKHTNEPERAEGANVTLIATSELAEDFRLHANLGWNRSWLEDRDHMRWALALEALALVKSLDGGIEVFGDDHAKAWLGAGLRWQAHDAISVDMSLARSLKEDATTVLSLGIKLSF